MAELDDDGGGYPLNCIDDTGDGFSGWFAISNPRRCNDFCYWKLPPEDEDRRTNQNGTNSSSTSAADESRLVYAAWNTANPHKSTVISTPSSGVVYWTCVYDSANDKTLVSMAREERWIDSFHKYYSPTPPPLTNEDVPFPYLKCQKGAGELLASWSGDAVTSATFWESSVVFITLIFVGEFVALYFVCWKRKRGRSSTRYAQVVPLDDGLDVLHERQTLSSLHIIAEGEDNYDSEEIQFVNQQATKSSTFMYSKKNVATTRCRYCNRRRLLCILQIIMVILLNGLLIVALSFFSLSMNEIVTHSYYSESVQKFTPACSDSMLICPAGNVDIDKQSSVYFPLSSQSVNSVKYEDDLTIKSMSQEEEATNKNILQPFSYIIASDAQLYWFNGEFANMGQQALPSSCTTSDSCARCTSKHGQSTNRRLQRAWESLMLGETDGMNSTNNNIINLPIPNTLVMNGDLTAYFHPCEKNAYDSIYTNIVGMKHYFPSLGNHDIEHPGGAMYGGDQWVGPPNCNMEHAIAYFKSGFCGQIPSFDADRIVRYDSSSLAYSWDQGRFHFVHAHYYPSYEMASVKYRSSLEWLERDLQIARDSGLTTILFVHNAQGLNEAMESVILGKSVRAIIAGHNHRCLSRRCEGVYPMHESQISNLDSQELSDAKCIPAAYDTCQNLHGEHMIYVKDKVDDVPFPQRKLKNIDRKDKPLCPKPAPFYINETDNSLLCRRVRYSQPHFPFDRKLNSTKETIPIFWSGSASFETFLRGDFYDDRFVINAMTVASDKGGTVGRYMDLHTVPNAVYPYHEASDIEEIVIYL